jgi:tRNA threonylcarbamoyladenosine biosynthesis protein TsaE
MLSTEAVTYITHSERETCVLGEALASEFLPGTLVALRGELGTGKTTLIKGICRHFQCERQVTSPTFTIVNEYKGSVLILHADLYRIGSTEELEEIGFEDFSRDDAITIVEWAERADGYLPVPRIEIACDYGDDEHDRIYRILFCGSVTNAPPDRPSEGTA